VGLAYGETFAGLFANARPEFEVLNASATSYAPIIYYLKLKWLLASYHVDHVIVFIDISDIEDEAFNYRFGPDGMPAPDFMRCPWTHLDDYKGEAAAATSDGEGTEGTKEKLARAFPFSYRIYSGVKARLAGRAIAATASDDGLQSPLRLTRSMWTVTDKLPCYGEGVSTGISRAKRDMTKFARLLRENGVTFSVAVYPWPDQLAYDTVNSKQVTLWRDWCIANGCVKFIDYFPTFFDLKGSEPFPARYFFDGDSHWNAAGNALVASRLEQEFGSDFFNTGTSAAP
jgi:hypothetical protein